MIIRAISEDIPRLVEIWEKAVRESHLFLTEADIQFYLLGLEVWLFENSREAVGLIGLDGNKVEVLFIDPIYHGKGFGKTLLAHAQHLKGKLSVNEQNPAALAFYLKSGFVKTGQFRTGR
ncbi:MULTISPECIES: GNAT family N-acetyltransferase [Yersinia]|nr:MULTISPECIES: GNAT family N-acetyltransferase [Yersinia]MDA5545293.1 GNAT family N-acetyltransferase [Yersinia rochesterensis]UZM75035.1 GNAT family N-acetyltransferase [Yersinia sp. SCPM-O-B-9106 (C-191)]